MELTKIVPSDADLHQMYVYLDIYGNNSNEEAGKKAKKVALLYPGQNITEVKGKFVNKPDNSYAQCDMLFLPGKSYNTSNNGKTEFQDWQEAIAKRIMEWMRPLTTQSTPNPTSVT